MKPLVISIFLLFFTTACQKDSGQQGNSETVAFSKAEQTIEKFYDYLVNAKMEEAGELLALKEGTFEMPGNAPVERFEIIDKRLLSQEEAEVMEKRIDPKKDDVMLEVKQYYVGGEHHIYTYWLRRIEDEYKIIDYESWRMEGYEKKIALDSFVDEVERMVLKEGANQWYIESEIKGFHVKDYRFSANKGQKMTIRLNSDDPYTRFGMFLQRDETTLNSMKIFKGKKEWEGKVPRDGEYRIRVYLKKKEAKKEHTSHYSLFVEII